MEKTAFEGRCIAASGTVIALLLTLSGCGSDHRGRSTQGQRGDASVEDASNSGGASGSSMGGSTNRDAGSGGTPQAGGNVGTSSGGGAAGSGGTRPTAGGATGSGGHDDGGTASSGGTAGNGGTAGSGGTAGNGGVSGGGGASGGGAAGSGGGGGTAGTASNCFVNADCQTPKLCTGSVAARRCVDPKKYCDSSNPCVQSSTGCGADHRCKPPLAAGAACTSTTECDQNTYCSQGVCTTRLTSGTSCGNDECAPGLGCWFYTPMVGPLCLAPAPEGGRCESHPCATGLYCVPIQDPNLPGSDPNAIVARCSATPPGTKGADCSPALATDSRGGCNPGLACVETAPNTSSDRFACVQAHAVGDDCSSIGPVPCTDGAFCADLDGKCHPYPPPVGSPCYYEPPPSPSICAKGAACGGDGICHAATLLGKSCADVPCADSLHAYCNASKICVAIPTLGQSCASHGCEFGLVCGADSVCHEAVGATCSAPDTLCADGLGDRPSTYCGKDKLCHAYPGLGESCVGSDGKGVECTDGGCGYDSNGQARCGIDQLQCDCLNSTCGTGSHICHRVQSPGEPCGGTTQICDRGYCGSDHVCHFDPSGPGHVCADENGAPEPCDSSSYCGTDKVCHARPGLGAACSDAIPCSSDLRCASGFDDGVCQ